MTNIRDRALASARGYVAVLRDINKMGLESGITLPDKILKQRAADAFWQLCISISEIAMGERENLQDLRLEFSQEIGPLGHECAP